MALSRRQFLHHGALMGGALFNVLPARLALAQNTRIRFSGFVGSQRQLTQTLAVLDAYMAKNPGVTIVPEFIQDRAFADKLATEAAGGNAPDMFNVNIDLLVEYGRRGFLAPLDGYAPDPLDLSKYADGAVKVSMLDEKLYAIPNDMIAPAMAIIPSAFKRANVAIPEQMWTWDALAETAVVLSKALGPRFWGVADAGENYIVCGIFLRSMGKSMFTPDRRFGFEPADLAEWFAYWQRLRDNGGTPPGEVQALESAGDISTFGIVNGRVAMHVSRTDVFTGLQSLMQEPLELHMMPNGFAGDSEIIQHHYTYAGNSTAAWTKSPHRDRIIDIIRFMTLDPEGARIYYHNSGIIPASQTGVDVVAREGDDLDRKILAYLRLIQKDAAPPRRPGVTGMSNMLRRASQGVAFGQLTPQQAAEQFVAEAGARL